jgi:2-methylcitrate dehydratase PrpD
MLLDLLVHKLQAYWEFLRDAADSKQLHTAHASMTGLMSAYLAHEGFTGAKRIWRGARRACRWDVP